jgi:hypothetical protein
VRRLYLGQSIMLAVDDLQIMEAEPGGRDIRQNISSASRRDREPPRRMIRAAATGLDVPPASVS